MNVCVAGCGVSGKAAIKELSQHPDKIKLTVIDSSLAAKENSADITYVKSSIADISAARKVIILDDGQVINFNKCLIALGRTKPNNLFYDTFIDKEAQHVYHYMDRDAMRRLSDILRRGGHVTIIGNNWQALQAACTLGHISATSGFVNNVSIVLSDFLLSSQLPKYLSMAIQKRLKSRYNVEVIPMMQVQYVGGRATIPKALGNAERAHLAIYGGGTYDMLNSVIFGTNAVLLVRDELSSAAVNTDLEKDSSGGLRVNQSLAACADIWVAGDAANIYTPSIGRGIYSGEYHAVHTGRTAAKNILGAGLIYSEVPVLDMQIEGAGIEFSLVGNCSTALQCYGYWWRAPVRRKGNDTNSPKIPEASAKSGRGLSDLFSPAAKSPATKKDTISTAIHLGNANTSRSHSEQLKAPKASSSAVYGDGIVFYINGDIICGVLLGGILSSSRREGLLAYAQSLIGQRLDIQAEVGNLGDQYLRYKALSDIATRMSNIGGSLDSTLQPLFVFNPASKGALRQFNTSLQSVGPSVANDNSFTAGNSSTISSAENTHTAYRRGINNRSATFG